MVREKGGRGQMKGESGKNVVRRKRREEEGVNHGRERKGRS